MPNSLAANQFGTHENTLAEIPEGDMAESRDAAKLNLNIVTVCALLVVIGGGAFSFATLFEQSRRNGESLTAFSDSMMALKISVATQGEKIQSLTDQLSRIERGTQRP